MNRVIRVLAAVLVLLGAGDIQSRLLAQGQGGGSSNRKSNRVYVVQMVDAPVGTYAGGVAGRRATKPNKGEKIDRENGDVVAYASYLEDRHNEALAAVGGRKVYDYRYTLNGFAAELTEAQADALKNVRGIVSVMKDEMVHADTSDTPGFLGLTEPGGLWDQLGGVKDAGENIVIGIVDSGVWPESGSFSDARNGNQKYHRLHGWHGTCEAGERFAKSDCNDKLIGAQHFDEAWGGDAGLKAERPWEYASPRDYNGHGTHTASTAGGNHGVATTGPAKVFGKISGIAPRARISVYKALYSTQDGSEASGFTSDLVAAIDAAIADGVDVINYSVSGTQTNFLDAAEIAFLNAAEAGVFVAASAGNSGPTASTVAHPSPWITTVGAATHQRSGSGSVTLGNGVTYLGPSLAANAVGPVPLIDSTAAGLPGANATALSLCFSAADNGGVAVLDPAKVGGKIVVCDRGSNARTNKSLAVQQAGGVGMILVNVTTGSQNADFHFVPTVHLADTNRAAIKIYAATAGATASISKATLVFTVPAPLTAAFSSVGPLRAGGGDLLKPDLTAPGQDILAAVAPPGNNGLSFNLYSGTSMSSPHVAGLAALLKQRHPDWSPMAIKSALMTTGSDVLDQSATTPSISTAALIFRQGAGHVVPNDAADPGLVYDSGLTDWFAFLCGATNGVDPATCSGLQASGFSLDPSDLNVPSIAIGDLAGTQTVTRRVTNVGRRRATYRASVSGLSGVTAAVQPPYLTLRPGETGSFTVTFTRTTAAVNTYSGGQLAWTDGSHSVRIPVVIRPVPLAAPASVSGTGGPITYNVTFGYTGPFAATPRGLVPATTTNSTVADDPTDTFEPGGPGTVAFPVTIPAGTTYARFALFDANVTPGSDLDVYVLRGSTLVAVSATGTSNEEANLVNPVAGSDYMVYVHGFATPPGGAAFRLFQWVLGSTAAGNMAVTAPATATTGATGSVTLMFNSLAAGTKYLGSVAYTGSIGLPNPTIVRVDVP